MRRRISAAGLVVAALALAAITFVGVNTAVDQANIERFANTLASHGVFSQHASNGCAPAQQAACEQIVAVVINTVAVDFTNQLVYFVTH